MAIENDLRLEALVKQLTREISGLKSQVNAISMTAQGRFTSISGGGTVYYDENGNPVVVVGQQPDGTYSSQDFNGERLRAPSDPIIEERAGTITVTWNGLDRDGNPYQEATFSHVEVHYSTITEFQATNSNEIASFHARSGGSVVLALDPIEHFFLFTVVNTSRIESFPSTEMSGTPLPVSTVGGIATYYENTEPIGLGGDDVGSLWFDTDDGNHQYRWDGANWIDVQDQTIVDTVAAVAAVVDSIDDISAAQDALVVDLSDVEALVQTKSTISYSSTRPTGLTATDRVTWYDPTNGYRAEYWNGTTWTVALIDTPAVDFVARDIGSTTTFYGTTTPTGAVVGDIWYNQNFQNRPERWNGSSWVVVRDATIADAAAAASAALTAANSAQSAADGAIRTWYQATAPTGLNNTTDLGDLWFDTDDGQAYRWNGSTWQIIEDNSIAAALAAASNAQTTADSKILAYYQTAQPTGQTAADAGDLWYDTDDGNRPYYWTGSAWQTIRDTTIATAQATADAAASAANAAILMDNSSTNPLFDDWPGAIPTGYSQDGGTSVKETTLVRTLPYALRFNVTTAQAGVQATTAWSNVPNADYLTVTVDLQLVSGSLTGSGVVIRWMNTVPTGFDATINFATEIPTPQTGKWYRITKTLQRPVGFTGTYASTQALLYGNNTAFGALTTKNIIFDQLSVRPASTAEAQSYNAATAASVTALTTTVNSKITTFYQTAPPVSTAIGDLWVDTDDNNQLYRALSVGADAITAGEWVSARDATIAAAQATADIAATTANAAILMDTSSTNPLFDNWPSTQPTGYQIDGGTSVKETTIVRTLPYALRFNPILNAQAGINTNIGATSAWANVPNADYLTVTVDFQLVSGALSGAGVLVQWRNTVPTAFQVLIDLATEVPAPQLGKWYRVEKVIQRPAGFTGTYLDTLGYLFGNQAGFGTMSAKNIVFDQFSVRPASNAEVQAYNSATAASVTSLTSTVNTKVRTFYQTAPPTSTAIGDLWVDTDDGNKLYRAGAVGASTIAAGQWESIQDATIATAQTAANNALSAANGKNKVYFQTAAPTGGTYIDGDTWFDTDDSNRIYKRLSGAWVAVDLGSAALATDSVTATQLANNAVDTLAIAANAVTAAKIAADTITANEIAANAITSSEILAGAVVAGKIGANAVTATEIAAGAVTASKLQVIIGGDNLQENSSFETTAPISWSSSGSSTLARQSTQSRRTGTQALSVTPTGGVGTGVLLTNKLGTRVQNGNNAVSSVWIKGTNANQVTIALRPTLPDAATTVGATLGARTWTLNGSWQRIYTDAAGSTVGQDYRPNIVVTAAVGTAVFYIDDVQSEEGDVPTSYKVMTDEILPGTIVATMVATDAITANAIAADAVTASELAANAVTAAKIQAGAVTTEKLTVGSLGDTAVLNGSFEDATDADATLPAGWTRVGNSTAATARLATDQFVGGSKSLKMTVSNGTDSIQMIHTLSIPAAPGETWYMSHRVRRSATGSGHYARLMLQTGVEVNSNTTAYSENVTLTANTWTLLENTFTLPAGTQSIRPQFYNFGPSGGNSDMWLDDVVLKKITVSAQIADGAITAPKIQAQAVTAEKLTVGSVGENVLLNGSLEELSTTTPTMAAGYVRGGYPTENLGVGSVVTSTSEFDSGTRSLQINVPAAGTVSFSHVLPIAVIPTEQYHISFRAKAASAHAGGMYMRPTNGSTEYTGNGAIENAALTTSWTTYESIFTVPAGVGNIYWYWRGNSPDAANAAMTIYVDNVRVRRVITSAIIADGAITTNKINSGYIYSGTVTANQITSGSLSSNVAVIGSLTTSAVGGRSISISSVGLKAFDPSGDAIAFIPTDLSQSISLQANVVAESITALGVVALRSPANELAQGAKLIMGASVAPPVSPPTVTLEWRVQDWNLGIPYWDTMQQGDSPSYYKSFYFHVMQGASMYTVMHADTGNGAAVIELRFAEYWENFDEFNGQLYGSFAAGSLFGEYIIGSSIPGSSVGERVVHGAAYYGFYIYTVENVGATWYVRKYTPGDATPTSSAVLSGFSPGNGPPGMTINDVGELVVCWGVGLAGAVWRRTFNRDTGAVIDAGGALQNVEVGGSGGYVHKVAVYEGLADTGVRKTWVAAGITGANYVYCCVSSTRLRDTNYEFYAAYNEQIGGLTYDSVLGKFKSFSAAGGDVHTYEGAGNTWTDAGPIVNWYVTSTWRDSNATGGTHETTQGPIGVAAMKKRSRLTITAPPIPSDPNPANLDDPNAVSIYVGKTAGAPRTSQWRQTNPADGVRNITVTNTVFTGTNPPATNNFPGATPGVIQSTTLGADGNPKFWVDGDGAGRWEGKVEDTGWSVPTLQNGFTNLSASSYDTFAIRRVNGIVFLRGMLTGGPRTNGTVIFTLPAGYRPGGTPSNLQVHHNVTAGTSIAGDNRINIGTLDGVVVVNAMDATTWFSLSYISFPAGA